MILVRSTISAFALFLASSVAIAKEGYYVSGQIGGAIPTTKLKSLSIIDDAVSTKQRLKDSITFSLLFGKEISNQFAAEIELSHSPKHKFNKNSSEFDGAVFRDIVTKAKVKTTSGFANLTYKHTWKNMPFTPYATLGAGISSNKISNITFIQTITGVTENDSARGKTKTNFAWQVGAGVLIPVTKSIDINFCYKYKDLGKVESSNITTVSGFTSVYPGGKLIKGRLQTSNIMLGIKASF